MHRPLLHWTLVFALLVAGFGATVLALNSDVFSAQGFVRSYLQTLARHDAEGALGFDGVVVAEGARQDLLSDAALGDIRGIRLISDVASGDSHVVRFGYTVATGEAISEFTVERTGTRLGLFASWRFSVSPVAQLTVAVDHDSRFTANRVSAASGSYAVLVPGYFSLDHESTYLEARAVGATVTTVGSTVEALVEVTPNDDFEAAAIATINAYLDDCATQQVLNPTACPFGKDLANRLSGLPEWSMVEYPVIEIDAATGTAGQWRMQRSYGTAHLTATVKSLFDGSISTLDEDVPFTATFVLSLGPDDSLGVSGVTP